MKIDSQTNPEIHCRLERERERIEGEPQIVRAVKRLTRLGASTAVKRVRQTAAKRDFSAFGHPDFGT